MTNDRIPEASETPPPSQSVLYKIIVSRNVRVSSLCRGTYDISCLVRYKNQIFRLLSTLSSSSIPRQTFFLLFIVSVPPTSRSLVASLFLLDSLSLGMFLSWPVLSRMCHSFVSLPLEYTEFEFSPSLPHTLLWLYFIVPFSLSFSVSVQVLPTRKSSFEICSSGTSVFYGPGTNRLGYYLVFPRGTEKVTENPGQWSRMGYFRYTLRCTGLSKHFPGSSWSQTRNSYV